MTEENKNEQAEEVVEEAVEETQTEENIDYKDSYIRLMAELANFKKRTQKEVLSTYTNAVCDTVEKLLPVMDNFDRAIEAITEEDNTNFTQGIIMIYKQLKELFEKLEVKVIDAVGQKFDPNIHNAVMHIDDESLEENVIVEEFMKGYMYKDKIIRHSMVKVAN